MANLVNHLKDSGAQRQVLAVASGRHDVTGHLVYSYTLGASPNQTIYVRQALGKGNWEAPEAVFYELPGGTIVIPPEDYRFYDGSQTAPGEFFPMDNPHTGTVLLDFRLPPGFGEADTKNNPPNGVRAICKCEKFPDFDQNGNQLDKLGAIVAGQAAPLVPSAFFYSANPARVMTGFALVYGRINRSRFNWSKWTAWRDFCAAAESVDYTALPGFTGIGLTASYFNGTNFETPTTVRLDPSVYFALSAGAPAPGVNADNFSARWEGFIKTKFAETYTFTLVHTQGARLWVNSVLLIDQFGASGTQTATFAAAANSFYPVKVEWQSGTGDAEIQLKWASASLPIEIIKPENLYPKTTTQPRYEAHIAFSSPTDLDSAIATVLVASNSIKQDVEGKMEFYSVEQLVDSFHFDDRLPEEERLFIDGSLTFSRSDVRINERQNVWECEFNNLGSQFLEKTTPPVSIKIASLITLAGREITGAPIPLPNMTPFQAYKVLQRLVDLAGPLKDLILEFLATARSFKTIAGDVGLVTHRQGAFVAKRFQVVEAVDESIEEKAGIRRIKLKEI